jgi:hypothetical protein
VARLNSPTPQSAGPRREVLDLVDFDTALTVYLALWTCGTVQHVEPHWQPSYWLMSNDDKAALTHFMAKLCRTADFAHPIGRSHLLHRFDRALKSMLADPTTLDHVMLIVRDAVLGCEDRSTHAFNHIDTAIRIQEILDAASSPANVTRDLHEYGLSLLRLEAVRRYATLYCLRFQIKDMIEVHLNFELQLKDELQLPLAATSSRHGRKFPIPALDLDAAAQRARQAAADPVERHDFFSAWLPWLTHQRQLAAQAAPYASLPLIDSASADVNWLELRCTIIQEPLDGITEPVFVGEGSQTRLYEYGDLMIWWIRHGTEPATRQPLSLEQLYRFAF